MLNASAASTSVVQARCWIEEGDSERDFATTASDLLTILTGSEHGVVGGGEVSQGVELWARTDDLGWLVLLCDDTDTSERAADWLLVGPLWKHEVAAHKAQRQFDQFRHLHRRLREKREVLHRLTTLLDDSGLRARMGEQGRRKVETRFSWASIASSYLELYAELGVRPH